MPGRRARTLTAIGLLSIALVSSALAQNAARSRLRQVLPEEGLDATRLLFFREQKALDAHYYLADETVLGLRRGAEAVLARYAVASGEALLLAVSYPTEAEAKAAYDRFGRDFFSKAFEAGSSRVLERLETGDYAGAARVRAFLIVVLEAPDRKSCDDLLGKAAGAAALL